MRNMMNYIEWEISTEERFDPYDPLGKIVFYGEEGKVEEECTYIDAFLEALTAAFKDIEIKGTVIIDPIVEPDDMIFYFDSSNVKIGYKEMEAKIYDKNKLFIGFRNSVQEFVEMLDQSCLESRQEQRELTVLRRYLETTE